MIRVIFCDDNSQFLSILPTQVRKECQKYIFRGEDIVIGPALGSGEEAINYIKAHHVDVLFLDIDMPNMSGFDVARKLCKDYPHIKIVFMSAYDNFVYSSFDYYPFAYLRKSHLKEELPKVIERIVEKMNETDKQLTVLTTEGMKKINVQSILYVESTRNYFTIHLIHSKEYVCRGTLSSVEKEFEGCDFFRVHSAFLVNLEHVEKILENGYVLVKNETLPIAQKRAKEFKRVYMDYIRRCFNT